MKQQQPKPAPMCLELKTERLVDALQALRQLGLRIVSKLDRPRAKTP